MFDIETNNFENFSQKEYHDNLIRLGNRNHSSLIGEEVYYCNKSYGKYIIVRWDSDRAEFLLELEGQRFWSNPFKIFF